MLPYLNIPELKIFGPFAIRPFGVLVATSIVLGYWLSVRRARRIGMDDKIMADAIFWAVVSGFIGAHLFWTVFYNPGLIVERPIILLLVWKGISSYGGFFGGALGAYLCLRGKKVPVLGYIESLLFGLVPAWVVARMGCTVVFDHPGRKTGFILGMADRAGVVRHNLGFYEMIWTLFICLFLYGFRKQRLFEGFHIALVIFLYAPMRIFFDGLRVDDRTWWGLTPGQYFSIVLLVIGTGLVVRGVKGKEINSNITAHRSGNGS